MADLSSFKAIIGLWGHPDTLAADIGAGVPAVRKWAQRGRIPAEWWSAVLATEIAKGAGLTSEILINLAAREPESSSSPEPVSEAAQ